MCILSAASLVVLYGMSLPAVVESLAEGRYDLVHLCSPGPAGIAATFTREGMAQIDADGPDAGVFRAVISHGDPGIANWLDAGGHEQGLLAIRYYEPDSTPIPTMRRVKLAELRAALPASIPSISAEARQKTLRDRAWAVARLGRE